MRALVTGITGQDGPYLARHLINEGIEVYGAYRRACTPDMTGLKFLDVHDKIKLIEMELTEYEDVRGRIAEFEFDLVFNLAAQSHVGTSFKQPFYTTHVNFLGVMNILEAIRSLGLSQSCRIYQASTSEMFGGIAPPEGGYNEGSEFWPRSPYGVSKLAAHWIMRNYREAYGMHTSCGILFNHESPLRGLNFITRKITAGMARLALDMTSDPLEVGNLEAERDWGHAYDYTKAMVLMLDKENPDDYVIATGRSCSVRHMIEVACYYSGVTDWRWEGEGVNEQLVDDHGVLVKINPKFYRPSEVDSLKGDSLKAYTMLNWKPEYCFEDLIKEMCYHDAELYAREKSGLKSKSIYRMVQDDVEKKLDAPTA